MLKRSTIAGNNSKYEIHVEFHDKERSKLKRETWTLPGGAIVSRENGPAIRSWNEEGELIAETWIVDDVYHRLHGPAMWCRNEDGYSDSWCLRGEFLGTDHPFLIFAYENSLHRDYEKWSEEYKVLFKLSLD